MPQVKIALNIDALHVKLCVHSIRASGRLLKASVRDKMEGKEEEKEPTKFVGGGGGSYVPAEAEEDKEFEEMLDIHPQ